MVLNTDATKGRLSVQVLPDTQKPILPYPTKRYIDVGDLPSVSRYDYELQSCSYVINSEITSDGEIKAITDGGESVEIDFNWRPPITIIAPNASSKDYANITYRPVSKYCGDCPFPPYVHFTAGTASLTFKYNSYTCDDFEVYTKSPRLIQVLPYIDTPTSVFGEWGNIGLPSIDGIGYYKTYNKDAKEFGRAYGQFGNGKYLDEAIKHITLVNGTFTKPTTIVWDSRGITIENNILLPENVTTGTNYTTKYGLNVNTDGNVFFIKNDDFLTSDDDDFTNIVFNRQNVVLKGQETGQDVKVFTVLVDREYKFETDDNLVKHIRTIETSDLYDCRDLFMKITLEGVESETSTTIVPLTYVEMHEGAAEGISGLNDSSVSVDEGDICGTTVVSDIEKEDVELGKDTTKIYLQTLTFDMKFDVRETTHIPDRQNEAFADYAMMSYVFRFHDQYGSEYDVIPSTVFLIDDSVDCGGGPAKILRFILKWPTNMGIIADKQWTGPGMSRSVPISVFARTPSNFVYKLTSFSMAFCCPNGQDPGGCSDNVEEEIKKPMEKSPDDDGNPVRYISHLRIDPRGGDCKCDF